MGDDLPEVFEPLADEATGRLLRPSWVDRLVDWIVRLPGPSWLAFLVLFVLLGLLAHLGFWAAGQQAPGSFGLDIFLNQLWMVAVLFIHHYLDQDAKGALNEFRPVMNVSDEEFASRLYMFTNLPARPVLVLTLIGIPLALYLETEFLIDAAIQGNALSPFVLIGPISVSLALIFSYRILRQLRIISRFYARASAIDLYDLDPVYALSAHTARTGLALLLAVYSNFVFTPEALEVTSLFVLVVLLTLLALAAFLLPLRGINRRLVEEKRKLLQSTQRRIKRAFGQVEERFDASELGEMSTLNAAVSALQSQKAFLEKIPTWPWQASTLRGFVSLLLLPLFIWAVQQILSRIFG